VGRNEWLAGYNLPRSPFADAMYIEAFDIFMVLLFAFVYDLLGSHYIEKT